MEFDNYNGQFSKLIKQKREMDKSLELGKLVNSNQVLSYKALAQITRSVPLRVNFSKMTFDGSSNITIEGEEFLIDIVKSNKQVIFISGHLSNFED